MHKMMLILIGLTAVSAIEISPQLINKNVERSIDLTSQLVKISAVLTLENAGKEPVRQFQLLIDADASGNTSFVAVKDALKEDLRLAPASANEYTVHLRQPLAAARSVALTVETVATRGLLPYPSSIAQKEKQLVRYFGSHYFYSPYPTARQTTTVTLASRHLESYTKLKPVAQADATITYGPYADVPALARDPLVVHFESNAPFLTVTRLERLIEISHWGNIAVEESVEILHTGAKLKGPFSRYDYQRDTSTSHHSVKSYRTVLPAAAYNIYYRDSNGNISTSQVRHRQDWIELELRPRFPLFGGWKSSYTLGYSVPSYQYLYKKSSNEFVLNMRLLDHVFDDMSVDELETSVVLPVGVTNVAVTAPYNVQRLDDGVTYKYLDHLGRTVIKLRKTNLVEQHIQDLEIAYNWQSMLLMHEPILLAVALYILFIIVIVYVRLDFSIHKPESKKD